MRNDVPAALPLALLIAGLSAGPLLLHPAASAGAFLAVAILWSVLRRRGAAVAFAFAAMGIVLAVAAGAREAQERRAFESLDPDVFTTIEAPIQRDWAPRDGSHLLRASRFTANGMPFESPLSIYVRFDPRTIAMESTVRVAGHLRRSEGGAWNVNAKSPELMSYQGLLPLWHPASWNRRLAQRLAPYAGEYPAEVALAEALVLGRGERLTEEMREAFRRGGTYHLLVFSGMQIALAAAALGALLRWLHAPRASDWMLLAFAAIAPPFIGPTASVSRASLGIGLYAISRIAKRPTSIENLWCVAALVRLTAVPADLTDPSFHLTYAGAGALLFIGKRARSAAGQSRLLSTLRFALAAEIAIAPLTLFHFHQYVLGGSLLTLAMSPLILAMLVISLVACAIPCDLVFGAIGALHRFCGVVNAGSVSGAFASPPWAAMIVGATAALTTLVALRGGRRSVAMALAMLVPVGAAIVRSFTGRTVDAPRVLFLDVGQGDAIAIRSGARTILVDGGRENRVLPLLVDRGIRRLEGVVLTHAHPDHCEGLVPVIEALRVGTIWVSPQRFRGDCATRLLEAARRSGTPIRLLRDGQRIETGDLTIDVVLPAITFRRAGENNASAVLRLQAGGRRFLLTGDIEKEAELYLADRDLRADVLKVAHHGSRSSTSEAFLALVRPRIAVISCGRSNPFGHPHPDVLGNLDASGIRTWRTDRDHSVAVAVRGEHLYVEPDFD